MYLRPNVGVFATEGGRVKGEGAGGEGFVLTPGTYALPLRFGTLWGFSQYALKIQARAGGYFITVLLILLYLIIYSPCWGFPVPVLVPPPPPPPPMHCALLPPAAPALAGGAPPLTLSRA